MLSSDFLSIVFTLTVFSLLSYKLYQMVTSYLIPYLYQQVRVFKRTQGELLEKNELLRATLQRVETRLKHQKKMFVILEKKVNIWHNFILEKQKQERQENESLMAKLTEKRKLQSKNFAVSKKMYEAIPQAVTLAGNELAQQYAGPKGMELLHNFVENLKSTKACLKNE